MVKQLLDEVKSAPLDDAARVRLAEIHERSIKELEDGLAPELVEELERINLPFPGERHALGRGAADCPGPAGRLARRALPRHPDGHRGAARRPGARLRADAAPPAAARNRDRARRHHRRERRTARRRRAQAAARIPRSHPNPPIRTTVPASTSRATLGFFSAARQGRKDDAELGKGLWRRAHDRFTRGLDRYHQVLEGVEDEALYAELVDIANELSALAAAGPAGLRGGPAAVAQRWTRHPGRPGRRPPGPVHGRKFPGHHGRGGGDAPARRRAGPGGCGLGAAPRRIGAWSRSTTPNGGLRSCRGAHVALTGASAHAPDAAPIPVFPVTRLA